MISYFNEEELSEKLKDFYTLTHIRITVFDASFQEILSYPNVKVPLCAYFREDKRFNQECKECDKIHMQLAIHNNEPLIYTCHAGITEIISPLILGKETIGYLFFSHILNSSSHEEALEKILMHLKGRYPFEKEKIESFIQDMPLFDSKYLLAASHMLEVVASYLVYNHLAYLKYEDLPLKIDRYIQENLEKDLSAPALCKYFSIGKTALYEISNRLYGEGLASHIKKLRIEKAKDLIREDKNVNISSIASEVGFEDYPYFIVAFKKETGMTPKKFKDSLK